MELTERGANCAINVFQREAGPPLARGPDRLRPQAGRGGCQQRRCWSQRPERRQRQHLRGQDLHLHRLLNETLVRGYYKLGRLNEVIYLILICRKPEHDL